MFVKYCFKPCLFRSFSFLYTKESGRQPYKPLINFQKILNNVNAYEESIKARNMPGVSFQKMRDLYSMYTELDEKETNLLIKRLKSSSEQEKSAIFLELKDLKPKISSLEKELYERFISLPNTISKYTPTGKDFSVIDDVKTSGKDLKTPQHHSEIGKQLNIIRSDNLKHVSFSRTFYLTGAGALLSRALIRFTEDRLSKFNFVPFNVPNLLTPKAIEGCGLDPSGERNQVFKLDLNNLYMGDPICLAGTSEHALVSYFMGARIPIQSLPLKLTSTSTCYRAEISQGQSSKGIYRVKQFDKVEMVGLASSFSESEKLFNEFIDFQREFVCDLQLPYRMIEIPAYDLGNSAHRKIDFEVWMPGRNEFGEISSCSNCTDYQSSRLHIRDSNKNTLFTVNGTACAVPRIIISILENYQTADGCVGVPEVLQPYMNGVQVLTPDLFPQLNHITFSKLIFKKNNAYLYNRINNS